VDADSKYRAQTYRLYAEAAERRARQAEDDAIAETYRRIAKQWRQLADSVKRHGM
jgi:hypothetical protein